MQPVFKQLLILMVVVWTVAVLLRRVGLPTIMGELLAGVILGPAVLGWVEPNEIIEVLAMLGIFFLMLHTGVETEPSEFFRSLRISIGVAVVGALVPFTVATLVANAFGLPLFAALFVGLTMTATAVVVTLKILHDLRLDHTRVARVIVASCVIDTLLTLVIFSIVLGLVRGGEVSVGAILGIAARAALFFGFVIAVGLWLYPLFRHPFRRREGKGFTFVLILGLAFGLLAEAIGLHIIVGAYMAGLFFGEYVAAPELVQKVEDRLNGIAYSFLGPIFFISLGLHITLEPLLGPGRWFVLALVGAVAVGQILSAGGMARLIHFDWLDSLMVGVGMCGRAEIAFVLASLALSLGVIDETVFSVLIFATFLLNLLTPLGLKACAVARERRLPQNGGAPIAQA